MSERANSSPSRDIGVAKQADTLKSAITLVLSVIICSTCYLLVPLGVVLAFTKMPTTIGRLAAALSVPVIWLGPTLITTIAASVLWFLTDRRKESIKRGWGIGVLVGAIILTTIWFLPVWGASWPAAATALSPLRVPGLPDIQWMMTLSWIVSIPMMVYANLVGVLDGTRSSESEEGRVAQSRSMSDVQSAGSGHSRVERGPDKSNSTTPAQSSSDLTYRWNVAPDVRFTDVGGMDDLKSEIERSILRPLMSTDAAYERFNISPPNGILLHGPPGTGKTHFARAIAGELGHPYLELSAGDLKSQWINESTEKVTQLFREAERFERCVIFIDEIDALLAERGNDLHHEHAQVVNEFLAQLDAEEPNFLLIAATNQVERLDEAATRRGRVDQQYEIGLPDREAREAIFRVQLRDMPTELDEQAYEQLAAQTEGLNGAEIAGIVEDAAVHAAEREARTLSREDLLGNHMKPDPT